MARILYSAVCNIPVKNAMNGPFHDGLLNALVREGNEVLVIRTNELFSDCYKNNILHSSVDSKKLNNTIRDFNPDIVFSFNNSLHRDIPKMLDCPIAIWAADSAPTFVDKEILKKNIDRYDMLHFTDSAALDSAMMYYGSSKERNHVIGYATDCNSEKLDKEHNISFIGTHFEGIFGFIKHLKTIQHDTKRVQQIAMLISAAEENPLLPPSHYINKLGLDRITDKDISHIDLLCLLSCSHRVKVLSAISDLGLGLYGNDKWYNAVFADHNFINSFRPDTIYSVKHNQDIYNKSKLSLNISHAQSRHNNLPWRVVDVMACDTVLLSDYKTIYKEMFNVDIPMFTTPFEARELAKKLLEEENWQKDIIAASNEAINQNYRFSHMFKKLEQIFSVNLLNNEKIGSAIHLDYMNYCSQTYKLSKKLSKIIKPIKTATVDIGVYIANNMDSSTRQKIKDWTPPIIYNTLLQRQFGKLSDAKK